ncbi:uncharacterized protein AMSG_11770 [Thecamonas trahens ATCC 50062]|uniref:Uncharacterized protein n=1 Tax=Thecamonas trahens ATCC 50062 TaxID=461836 RepID=A0A0L0D422_THETB|nr:hypothetical protein AMSG_11770 [Thecamonas trahens ATCC 50062]KNC47087.1 hypothetical protein AMSG_11770 [Thecamonas trahens ATCC 50062]|eukprot:XP_013760003.1 hypothetical protein AMSG_11770 [Thecamonas trahens ATCC 50062]
MPAVSTAARLPPHATICTFTRPGYAAGTAGAAGTAQDAAIALADALMEAFPRGPELFSSRVCVGWSYGAMVVSSPAVSGWCDGLVLVDPVDAASAAADDALMADVGRGQWSFAIVGLLARLGVSPYLVLAGAMPEQAGCVGPVSGKPCCLSATSQFAAAARAELAAFHTSLEAAQASPIPASTPIVIVASDDYDPDLSPLVDRKHTRVVRVPGADHMFPARGATAPAAAEAFARAVLYGLAHVSSCTSRTFE